AGQSHFAGVRKDRVLVVGRTPWSAADALVGLLESHEEGDGGVPRGPGGPPYDGVSSRYGRIRRCCHLRSATSTGMDLQTIRGSAPTDLQRDSRAAAISGGVGRADDRVDAAAAGHRPDQYRGRGADRWTASILHGHVHLSGWQLSRATSAIR